MSSHTDGKRRRLRVPAALAVAFVASSTTVAIWYGGCQAGTPEPDPPDAGRLQMARDAFLDDAEPIDAGIDAGEPTDAAPPDTPHT